MFLFSKGILALNAIFTCRLGFFLFFLFFIFGFGPGFGRGGSGRGWGRKIHSCKQTQPTSIVCFFGVDFSKFCIHPQDFRTLGFKNFVNVTKILGIALLAIEPDNSTKFLPQEIHRVVVVFRGSYLRNNLQQNVIFWMF